jgi:hypothetical protein
LFVSSEAGALVVAAVRRAALARGAGRRVDIRRAALRRGVARRAMRFAVRLTLRLADRFAVFLFDAFLLEPLRDFAADFAAFRRFLAMRAPPVEWARVFYLISYSRACRSSGLFCPSCSSFFSFGRRLRIKAGA